MRVFLGITGASGAPYAERLLRALAAVDCEVGLCASRSGIEVLATELYRDPSLAREEVLERLVGNRDVRMGAFEFMHVEEPAVEIGHVADQLH